MIGEVLLSVYNAPGYITIGFLFCIILRIEKPLFADNYKKEENMSSTI